MEGTLKEVSFNLYCIRWKVT